MQPNLPDVLKLKVTDKDLPHAYCGMSTKCAIANALRRQRAETGEEPYSYVKVSPNKITVTSEGVVHRYTMPDAGLSLIARNDDGTLALTSPRPLTLRLMDVMAAHATFACGTKERIKAGVQKRRAIAKAQGAKPKSYGPGIRMAAAIAAGVAAKKLSTVRRVKA